MSVIRRDFAGYDPSHGLWSAESSRMHSVKLKAPVLTIYRSRKFHIADDESV